MDHQLHDRTDLLVQVAGVPQLAKMCGKQRLRPYIRLVEQRDVELGQTGAFLLPLFPGLHNNKTHNTDAAQTGREKKRWSKDDPLTIRPPPAWLSPRGPWSCPSWPSASPRRLRVRSPRLPAGRGRGSRPTATRSNQHMDMSDVDDTIGLSQISGAPRRGK